MENNFNMKFFDAAMKMLKKGSTAEEFATNYANASNAQRGSSVWQQNYQAGLQQFETMDFHSGSKGQIDEDEYKVVGLYVERLNGKTYHLPDNIDELNSNSSLAELREYDVQKQPPARADIAERHNLKPIDAMSEDEIRQELAEYKALGLLEDPSADNDTEGKLNEQEAKPSAESEAQIKHNIDTSKLSADSAALIERMLQSKTEKAAKHKSMTELELLKKQLGDARLILNTIDAGSDEVDFHVGTFNQGKLGSCVMLSQLNGLSDETLRRMIKPKTDDNGKKYYEVTFPIDSNSGKSVVISEEELQSQKIQITDGNITKNLTGFSTGDMDVTLLEMAFYKRFGVDAASDGVDVKLGHDIFTYPEENKQHVGTSYELTETKVKEAVANRDHVSINFKHPSRLPENFSYNSTITSASGITANWIFDGSERDNALNALAVMFAKYSPDEKADLSQYERMSDAELMDATNRFVSQDYGFCGTIQLSNGYKLMENHAYSLKGYDENTKEIILANPHKSNEDIRIPIDIASALFDISV